MQALICKKVKLFFRDDYIVWNGPEAVRLDKLGFMSRRKMIVRDDIGVVSAAYEKLKKILRMRIKQPYACDIVTKYGLPQNGKSGNNH